MLIQLIIDTDDNSVIVLASKNGAPKSREVKETIDKELVSKVKKFLPKLADKLRGIKE